MSVCDSEVWGLSALVLGVLLPLMGGRVSEYCSVLMPTDSVHRSLQDFWNCKYCISAWLDHFRWLFCFSSNFSFQNAWYQAESLANDFPLTGCLLLFSNLTILLFSCVFCLFVCLFVFYHVI